VTSEGRSGAAIAPGERRRSRERALELLYEAESKGVGPDVLLVELQVRPEQYATELIRGVVERAAEIDALIVAHSKEWALDRMPVVDRQLLRMATFELVARPDVPTAVVLDEAVELAKSYSTENSGRFVNGVLAAIALNVRAAPESVE
jgi:transcription antitermination protein NusB